MSTDSGFGHVRLFDDFLGDSYDTFLWSVPVANSGTAPAINVQVDGVIRLTVTDNSSNDLSTLVNEIIYRATQGGPLVFEARVKPITSLSVFMFIGLADAKPTTTATTIPMNTNGGTFTTGATDAVGFMYTGGSSGAAVWQCAGVKNGADTAITAAAARYNPVLTTYQTLRIVVNADGAASFYIDGNIIKENLANAVTAGTLLAPVISLADDGAAGSLDVDYVYVCAGRV